MRVFYFPFAWTVALDGIAWFCIHMGVSYVTTRMRLERFNPAGWFYRQKNWERDGNRYQNIFWVKTWKGLLPDGAALFAGGFRKKQLQGKNEHYLRTFAQETCRAEYAHWVTMLFAPLFFLWNPFWVGVGMMGYALLANLPCIIAQRYNRIRLERLLKRKSAPLTDRA